MAIFLYIVYVAITHFVDLQKVDYSMIFIPSLLLIVNIGIGVLLMRGDSKENLTITSALSMNY
jgi:Co/Zn/Cd efflux system component